MSAHVKWEVCSRPHDPSSPIYAQNVSRHDSRFKAMLGGHSDQKGNEKVNGDKGHPYS
jgi:hypothetical protein